MTEKAEYIYEKLLNTMSCIVLRLSFVFKNLQIKLKIQFPAQFTDVINRYT